MSVLLQVRYLIFLLPLGVSVFLLIASMIFSGGSDDNADGGSDADSGDMGGSDGDADGGDFDGGDAEGDGDGGDNAHSDHHDAPRTPRSLLLNGFSLAWGVFGMGANQVFFPGSAEPGMGRFWPVVLIALVGGIGGAAVMKQFARRLMPGVQTQTVSRNALFGLTGTVLYEVTETSGRIRVYDEFGSMHDEACRTAPGAPLIPKGKRAHIADRDHAGRLIVEEL